MGQSAAEATATGTNVVDPGGFAATAQAASSYNESRLMGDEDKVELGYVSSVSIKYQWVLYTLH